MLKLFTKARINGIVLANRFVRSATYEALADTNGCATSALSKSYCDLADGGVGLIISSCTQVDPHSKHHPTMLSLVSEEAQQALGATARAVHAHRSLLACQITHSGPVAKPFLTNWHLETPDSVSKADIDRIIGNFVKAAKACVGVGLDAVQIHAAGKYFLGSSLSPAMNHRTDEFGGNQRKRNEIVRRVIEGVRKEVPSSFPVLIKISGADAATVEDLVETAKMAENAGVDAIEITLGIPALGVAKDVAAVAAAKKLLKVPVILCGGFLDLNEMENAVKSGLTDCISLSRPLIRQPDLIRMFKEGRTTKASCKNCNGCLSWTSKKENPLRCVLK